MSLSETNGTNVHVTGATLREAIIDYVRRHPQAMDTAEGIANWWLRPVHQEFTKPALLAVLEDLVASRRLRRVAKPDGGDLYARGADLDKASGSSD
jgi:hypothetical protein